LGFIVALDDRWINRVFCWRSHYDWSGRMKISQKSSAAP
jgi:hypothetical protein